MVIALIINQFPIRRTIDRRIWTKGERVLRRLCDYGAF